MKAKSVLLVLIVALNSFSAPKKSPGVSSQSAQSIKELDNSIASSKVERTTPISLAIPRNGFDMNSSSSLLAPLTGTEVALGASQTRIKTSQILDGSNGSIALDTFVSHLSIAHAFSESFFIGTSLSYGQSKNNSVWSSGISNDSYNSSINSNGELDPTFTAGGRVLSANTSMLFSLSAKIKTGDAQEKSIVQNSSNSVYERNTKSGRNSLIPMFAIYASAANGIVLGGMASYTIQSERTSRDTDADQNVSVSKSTGSNVQKASLFLETPNYSTSVGGSVDYTKFESSRTKTEETGFSYEYDGDAFAFTTVTGFVNLKLNKSFAIIPSLSYGRFGEGAGNLDEKDISSANVLAKIGF